MNRSSSPESSRPRTPRDIARDTTLTSARKIELLTMIKDHNAAPWQKAVVKEADAELSKLLRGGERPRG